MPSSKTAMLLFGTKLFSCLKTSLALLTADLALTLRLTSSVEKSGRGCSKSSGTCHSDLLSASDSFILTRKLDEFTSDTSISVDAM